MKTKSTLATLAREYIFNLIIIILSYTGLGYALVNHFILNKQENKLLVIMCCFFVIAVTSLQRRKLSKINVYGVLIINH